MTRKLSSWLQPILLSVVFVAPGTLAAQEIEEAEQSEWVREIDEELRAARTESERLQARLAHTRRRIELLSQMRELGVKVHQTELRLEDAEREGDDESIEELESNMHQWEVRGEALERRLRLHEQRNEIEETLGELEPQE
ncbi:MAG: hypothetical protein AAFX06_33510, partial [Planctomycetota bacterium]